MFVCFTLLSKRFRLKITHRSESPYNASADSGQRCWGALGVASRRLSESVTVVVPFISYYLAYNRTNELSSLLNLIRELASDSVHLLQLLENQSV